MNGLQLSRNATTLLSDFFESGVSTFLEAVKFINIDANVAPALKHIRTCSNLSLLNLGKNSSIDDDTLIHILQGKRLVWSTKHAVYPYSRFFFLGCGSSLRKLSLEGCDRITNSVLDAVAQFCPLLCELDLAGCHAIGDEVGSRIPDSGCHSC